MYPQAELDRLAERKRVLLGRITVRREELAVQVKHALRPVRWADMICAKWREISPALKLMGLPLGHVGKRKLPAKTSDAMGGFFRWAPLAVSLFRSMR
jgi:hypothetical protein